MDFAKLLAKIDSIESTKQLNESGAKPDFLDLDKDGNRTEPMKQAAKDAEAKKSDNKEEGEKLDEVSAPGQEEWIKKNKKRFIDQYGKKKGMEVLYATAWKRSKKVDEARQLEECYGQAMQGMGGHMNDRSGMSVSSSLDTRTGTKTLSVSAEGDAADQLAQLLKLSGMMTPAGNMSSGEVELEEYANEPNPEVQGIETQLQQGNDLNRPKKMTPHGYRNGDNPLAMDVREQEELSALTQALSEELEGIKVDKSKVPAYKRKQQGGDWKTTQQDLKRERERNISGAEGLAALKKKQGLKEQALKPLSVEQLATISDEALDNAYHYGRSTPGGSFGWQANLMSAAYAKKMIEAGITDIEKISDAIHKGWNVTAQKFVQNPDQFTDTEKLRAAGKLDAKLQQREKLMRINYAQLPEDEKEKDRVVARALLAALTGQQQGVTEAKADPTSTWVVFYTAERKSYDEKPSSVTDEETIVAASSKEEAIAKVKKMSKVGTNMYGFSARPARKSDGLDSDDIAEQRVTEGSASGRFQLYGIRLNSKKKVPFGSFSTIDEVMAKANDLDTAGFDPIDPNEDHDELHLLDTQTGKKFIYTDDGVNQKWEPIQGKQGVAEGFNYKQVHSSWAVLPSNKKEFSTPYKLDQEAAARAHAKRIGGKLVKIDQRGHTIRAGSKGDRGVTEGEIAQDPVADFLSKGGRVQQLPTKKPRKSEKTDYSSTHIGKGVPGKRNDSMGRAANVNRGGKPVVGL